MWNGRCFERSDILAHDLTLNLFHYPDDCPSILPNTDSQLPFDQEVSDKADEFAEAFRIHTAFWITIKADHRFIYWYLSPFCPMVPLRQICGHLCSASSLRETFPSKFQKSEDSIYV